MKFLGMRVCYLNMHTRVYLNHVSLYTKLNFQRQKNHEFILYHVILNSLSFLCCFLHCLALHGDDQLGLSQTLTDIRIILVIRVGVSVVWSRSSGLTGKDESQDANNTIDQQRTATNTDNHKPNHCKKHRLFEYTQRHMFNNSIINTHFFRCFEFMYLINSDTIEQISLQTKDKLLLQRIICIEYE